MFAVTEAPAPAVYAVPVAMVQYAAQMLAVFVTPPAASVIRERRCEGAGQNEPRAGASGAFQNTLLRSILLCVVRACLVGNGSCWPLSCIQYAACHLVHRGRRQNGGHVTKRDMDYCTEAGHTLQVSV